MLIVYNGNQLYIFLDHAVSRVRRNKTWTRRERCKRKKEKRRRRKFTSFISVSNFPQFLNLVINRTPAPPFYPPYLHLECLSKVIAKGFRAVCEYGHKVSSEEKFQCISKRRKHCAYQTTFCDSLYLMVHFNTLIISVVISIKKKKIRILRKEFCSSLSHDMDHKDYLSITTIPNEKSWTSRKYSSSLSTDLFQSPCKKWLSISRIFEKETGQRMFVKINGISVSPYAEA